MIEGNCEIVSNKCPIDESLPCVNTLEGEGLEKPKTIYSAGSSKKTETEILGLKNCAGVLSNDKCLLAGKEITFDRNWKSFVIPFSELGGAPAFLNEIVFQEFNNDGGDKLYIDDVGFVLN